MKMWGGNEAQTRRINDHTMDKKCAIQTEHRRREKEEEGKGELHEKKHHRQIRLNQ